MPSIEGVFIEAIQAIYQEDITDADYDDAVPVSSGETASVPVDKMIPTAKVVAEESHRYEALRFIYKNWERVGGDSFDKMVPMFLIEMQELLLLWQSREEHTCIMRACSFFEAYFSDTLDVSPLTRYGPSIDAAASDGLISQNERKLFHFVREVRNECGHNSWLSLDYPRELLVFACTTSNFLVGELADRSLPWSEEDTYDDDADPIHFLRKIEEDFQWTCAEEDGNIEWNPPESWSHPDREYSTYEDVWEDLDRE